ncbi:DUF803 domain membrane protein [Coprinopsis cinerea AmutBmut pab1-1]|nr:DUF803 domain membrane protein [Coprinopsis cinerea AmutBmut pab1-1]
MAHIQPPPVLAYGLSRAMHAAYEQLGDLPRVSTKTFIGILVAISGNVLISFALNLQKLVHKRIEQKNNSEGVGEWDDGSVTPTPISGKQTANGHFPPQSPLPEEAQEDMESGERGGKDKRQAGDETPRAETSAFVAEVEPPVPVLAGGNYGSVLTGDPPAQSAPPPSRTFASRLLPFKLKTQRGERTTSALPVEVVTEETALHGLDSRRKLKRNPDSRSSVESNEGDYLKSKLWWLGFLLMNIGEVGNFISYAFAPASVVAPLGTFALIANCFFAPLMLKERFRKRDLAGVVIAVIGAVTVVLASNASDTRLDADRLMQAIRQIPFLVFSAVYAVGAIILATLSQGSLGRRYVVIDVGLCALFGGFTVLSTKAISTLLTTEWMAMFTKWITYPLILILVGTGVGQIRYLNRALMRFDSKMVIPIQFVLFTLSAIVGSAILYGDFKKAQFHQIVTFLYGCAATFTGVFIIAWAPNDEQSMTDNPDVRAADDVNAVLGSPDQTRLGLGTIGRRRRATLVLPSGVRDTPSIRHKRSTLGMGISPAQHLLLVHTPPGDLPLSSQMREDGLNDTDTELGISSPESCGRPRRLSWYGNETAPGSRTRDSSIMSRRPNVSGLGRYAGS